MAAAPNPGIHLEAMEETENQTSKPDEIESSKELRQNGGIQQTRVLVYGGHRSCEKGYNKRKTHARGIL